jgi:uncharacterized membrane protein
VPWRPNGRAAGELSSGARSRQRWRRAAALLPFLLIASLGLASGAAAAGGLEVSTPYAAVAVEPGETASFDLTLTSNAERRVALSVSGVPDGWTATIRGGGFIVDGVVAGVGDEGPELTLDVDVPDGAADGTYSVTVNADGGGAAQDSLQLDLRVAAAAAGELSLTTDNPLLRDDAGATFPFSLTLRNDTPRDLTFASPGAGWVVNATPSGQAQAASVAVDAGSSTTISVSVDPPDGAAAGTYDIGVTASAGDQSAEAALQVEIVGQVDLQMATVDGRLSTSVEAGAQRDVSVILTNGGTAPITALTLSGTGPQEWDVTFEPSEIEQLAPGTAGQQTVTAHIRPSGSAIAGDYVVTLSAATPDGVTEELQMRVTVQTSSIWWWVGLGLIAVVVIGLLWVFQRYGRR